MESGRWGGGPRGSRRGFAFTAARAAWGPTVESGGGGSGVLSAQIHLLRVVDDGGSLHRRGWGRPEVRERGRSGHAPLVEIRALVTAG